MPTRSEQEHLLGDVSHITTPTNSPDKGGDASRNSVARTPKPKKGKKADEFLARNPGAQPIHHACARNDLGSVQELLKKNPDLVNAKDDSGNTPLHFVAKQPLSKRSEKSSDVIKMLYDKEAVNEANKGGFYPFDLAKQRGHEQAKTALLLYVPQEQQVSTTGEKAVHAACRTAQKDILDEILLKYRNTPNLKVKDKRNRTVLHAAVVSGDVDVVGKLMKNIGNSGDRKWFMKQPDAVGETPLALALKISDPKITDTLIESWNEVITEEESTHYDEPDGLPVPRPGQASVRRQIFGQRNGYTETIDQDGDEPQNNDASVLDHGGNDAGDGGDYAGDADDDSDDDDSSEGEDEVDGGGEVAIHEILQMLKAKSTKVVESEENEDLKVSKILKDAVCNKRWSTLDKMSKCGFLRPYKPRSELLHCALKVLEEQELEENVLSLDDIDQRIILDTEILVTASENGKLQSVKYLLRKHDDSTKSIQIIIEATTRSAAHGHISVFKVLFNHLINTLGDRDMFHLLDHILLEVTNTNIVEELISIAKKTRWWKDFTDLPPKHGPESPFLKAVENGNKEICLILKNNIPMSSQDTRDSDGYLGGCYVAAEFGHKEILEVLLEQEKEINEFGTRKEVLLHIAADKGHVDVVEYLLTLDIQQMDLTNISPFSIAVTEDNFKVVKCILKSDKWKQHVDPYMYMDTKEKENPVQQTKQKDKAEGTYDNSTKQTKTQEKFRVKSPLMDMIENMPDAAILALDKCVDEEDKKDDGEQHGKMYKISTEYLKDTMTWFRDKEEQKEIAKSRRMSSEKSTAPENSYGQINESESREHLDVKTISSTNETGDKQMPKEPLHPMTLLSKDDTDERILNHPVVLAQIQEMWERALPVYLGFLLYYLIFLTWLTASVVLMSPSPDTENKMPFVITARIVIIILAFCGLAVEIVQLRCVGVCTYWRDPTNYLDWMTYILACIVPWKSYAPAWLVSLAILFAWVNFAMFMRRLPRFAIYVSMIKKMIVTLVPFFVVLLVLLFGFAMAFHSLLIHQGNFETPWLALMKTYIMMVGELEYEAMLPTEESSANGAFAYILLATFTFALTILVMNLLTALAVGDVGQLQQKAKDQSLKTQIELSMAFEPVSGMVLNTKAKALLSVLAKKARTRIVIILDPQEKMSPWMWLKSWGSWICGGKHLVKTSLIKKAERICKLRKKTEESDHELERKRVEALNTRLGEHKDKLGAHKSELGAHKGELEHHKSELKGHKDVLEGYKKELEDHKNMIVEYRCELEKHGNMLGVYRNEIGEHRTELEGYKTDLGKHSVQMKRLESQLSLDGQKDSELGGIRREISEIRTQLSVGSTTDEHTDRDEDYRCELREMREEFNNQLKEVKEMCADICRLVQQQKQ